MGLVKIVGAGFAIALLALLIGILYGVFKLIRLCCCCCCKKSDKSDDSEYGDEPSKGSMTKWIPTGFYVFFWVFMITGMIFGILNNPRFTDGVHELGGHVLKVQSNAIDLGDGLLSNLNNIIVQLPLSLGELLSQISGVSGIAREVVLLGQDVDSTSFQVSAITAKVAAIDAGNTTALASLNTELERINNSSSQVIGDIDQLTTQLSDKLLDAVNSTLTGLDEKIFSANDTVGEIRDQAYDVMDQARRFTEDTTRYINDAKSYDESRAKAVTALFSFVIVVSVTIVAGYFLSMKIIFNVVAAFGFAFCFLLWFSGAIHFLVGMALSDACPIMNTVVGGLIDNSTDGGRVLEGCLLGSRTVLQSMNKEKDYNFTAIFDNQQQFDEFTHFSDSFNFSTIDSYFDSIATLYSYNLTAVAGNLTVSNFGWNDSIVYTALDTLNNQTYPTVYTLSDYQTANPNLYPPPKNQTVYDLQALITTSISTNQTIYNKTALARQQLNDAQGDINVLLSNYTVFDQRYDNIKNEFDDLRTKNIPDSIAILENLKKNVSDFMQSGNCSFVGDTYNNIRQSMCGTMQPAIDLLTVAQFLAGIALIPMTIIAELMSFRIAKLSRVGPCGNDDIDEESGQRGGKRCEYAVAMTDSTASTGSPAMRGPLSATIADGPGSAANTPDMQRRIIGKSGDYSV